MNPKPTTIDADELLERKAILARRRLMNTVDELDARKNEVEREASLLPVVAGAIGAMWMMVHFGSSLRRWNQRRRAPWRRVLRALHLR
jgi:hypothetical protein